MGRPIRLASAARYTDHPPLSHQLAAWNWLEDQLEPDTLTDFAEMFRADPRPPKAEDVILKVPYFSQLDNASGYGWRECFSSSCAMIAAFYGKVSTDDEYNRIRSAYGDTTSSTAQVRAISACGLKPQFHTDGSSALLEKELRAGRPVAVGWLHKGPAHMPQGGGHWSVVIGFNRTHWILNDPYGEAAVLTGGYAKTGGMVGSQVRYSRKNWDKRWMVEGPSSGWCLTVGE